MTNFFSKILDVLQKILRKLHWIFKRLAYSGGMLAGPGVAVLSLSLYGLWFTAVDSWLSAASTLMVDFPAAFSGAPGTASIADILVKANYYFPLDTLGSLAGLYVSLWVGVTAYTSGAKILGSIRDFAGVFKG